MILKKGYYVLNTESMEIVSGEQAISESATAEQRWKEISQQTPGPAKFVILWVPYDNLAWGE